MFKGNVIPENVSFCDGYSDIICGEMISQKCNISRDVENLSECKRLASCGLQENQPVEQLLDPPNPIAYLFPDNSILEKKREEKNREDFRAAKYLPVS